MLIWTDEKQRWEESEKRKGRRKKIREQKESKKEDAGAGKGRIAAKHCVFPIMWGSRGVKRRLAKAAGAEPSGEMRNEKLHPLVARSTFRNQNAQNTSTAEHFWKLRCWKSTRRCGAKHIWMLKKRTSLWCEAHFEVKMVKTTHVRTIFGRSTTPHYL